MKLIERHLKNIAVAIASFLIIFWAFKLANISIDYGYWLLSILLLLIYFEVWDISKK